MVEFLNNSSIYEIKNQNIFINGYIFSEGDLRVKVGTLTVNYPKFLLVQVTYAPSIYNREDNRGSNTWKQAQVDELVRYCLRIEQAEIEQKRLKNNHQSKKNVATLIEEKQCMQIVEAIRVGQE